MHIANPWKSYRQIAAQTAPPGRLILMLYDGALKALEQSLPGFSNEDPAGANMIIHNNLQRALDIIRALDRALNMEQGGECAATLHRLYEYFDRRIRESNIQKRRQGVEEIIRLLTELRNAWAMMLNKEQPAEVSVPADASLTLAAV